MRILTVLTLAALSCSSAFGWGCEGHQIVALIAGQHLTPQARAAVDELLKANPIDPALRRFCQPPPADAMADSATWADDSKRGEKTGQWHYLDIPRGVEHADLMKYCQAIGDAPTSGPDAGKDRPGCLYTALSYELDILKNKGLPAAQRATALRYIIHFLGDLHMPLHTTANDDQGGNCTAVTLFDDPKPGSLHGTWDYGLIQHYLKQKNETPAQLATELDREFAKKGKHWLHDPIDFGSWIREGHGVAEKVTYKHLQPKLPVAPAENGPGCAAEREKSTALKIHIDERYAGIAMPAIDKQLAKAGYRLADVLNSAL